MRRLAPFILIAAAVLAYHNSFSGPFIFDDVASIQNNPHIRRLWPLTEAMSAPPQTTAAGRPILSLSLALNYAVSGLRVWSYHAFNLAVHIINGLLLFGILRRSLRDERGEFAAFAVALIWLVHPLQTSSVTYMIQRAESLMGLFYLLTLHCVIRKRPVAAVVACALGMATKETMVTAPLMVLAYDRFFCAESLHEIFRLRWRLYAGLAATWLVLGALTATAMRTQSVGFGLENVGALDYAKTQCEVIVHYLRLALWPRPLVLDYYWPVARSLQEVAASAFLVACLLCGTAWAVVRRPSLGFLGVWFFVILAPSSSFLPIITETAAEHRMYLSLAAVVALAVVGAYRVLPRWGCVSLAVIVPLILGYLTVQRNADYRTELSIWSDTVAKRPNNPRAHNNLGKALAWEGKLDEAAKQYSEALRLEPGFAAAHYNLGKILAARGKVSEAMTHYSQAVLIKPDLIEARVELGIALGEQGKLEEAMEQLSEALHARPDSAVIYYNIGVVLARQGELKKALESFEKAAALDPEFVRAREDLRRRLDETRAVVPE